MTKTQIRQLKQLTVAVKQIMVSVAYLNADKIIHDNLEDTVDHDIDTAFMSISYCFPDFSTIDDTVTRRCAKTEIYLAIDDCKTMYKSDNKFNILDYLEKSIDAESVIDDVKMMFEDDEDDEEIELDFDTDKVS